MSAIDDIRKLLQDIVSPDLKALDARVTALDKKVDLRHDALDKKIGLTRDLILAEIREIKASMEITL